VKGEELDFVAGRQLVAIALRQRVPLRTRGYAGRSKRLVATRDLAVLRTKSFSEGSGSARYSARAMVRTGNLMPRLGVSLAFFVGTAVTLYAADRITPTCDPNRVPACWVEHGEGTGPQLVPVEPEQYDLPPPPPPGALVPPLPG
jgi:hypothetical protein